MQMSIEAMGTKMNAQEEVDIVMLLGQRYGDGLVYLRGGSDRLALEQAIELGLVSDEGYLTPAGYQFWQRKQN